MSGGGGGGHAQACGSLCEVPVTPQTQGQPESDWVWRFPNCNNAVVTVTVRQNNQAYTLADVCITGSAGLYSVNVELPQQAINEFIVTIDGDESLPSLNAVTLLAPLGAQMRVSLSDLTHVNSITKTGPGPVLVSGAIAGNLGSVSVSALEAKPNGSGMTVGGNATGNIILDSDAFYGPEKLGLQVDGSITSQFISVPGNAIRGISANGAIGAPGSPVTIRAGLDIGSIKAKEIHANVIAGWNGPSSKIYRVAAVGGNGSSGDLTGSISAATIGQASILTGLEVDPPGIEVKGNLGSASHGADLTFTQGLSSVEGNPRLIRVDGSFVAGSRITLPANGLAGQILFNLADAFANWLQGAEVVVGPRVLTTRFYPDTPDQLGGGSVGVARFDLHATACEPMNGQTVSASVPPNIIIEDPSCQQLEQYAVSPVEAVFVRHYGPVTYTTGDREPGFIPPFTIRQAPLGTDDWTNVTSEYYAESPSPAGLSNTVALKRTLGRKWPLGMKFEIIPTADLKCLSVNGTPVVATYTYHFSIRFKCDEALVGLYDLDGSNSLSLADMAAWLASPTDVTRDGAASAQDLTTLGDGVAEYQSLPPN